MLDHGHGASREGNCLENNCRQQHTNGGQSHVHYTPCAPHAEYIPSPINLLLLILDAQAIKLLPVLKSSSNRLLALSADVVERHCQPLCNLKTSRAEQAQQKHTRQTLACYASHTRYLAYATHTLLIQTEMKDMPRIAT